MQESEYKTRRVSKKIIGLIFLMTITSTILIVSTYAWFVGTGSVSTSTLQLSVSSAEGLELSLDGEHWEDETLDLSQNNILGNASATSNNKGYVSNKNAWPTDGLYPISTKGEVDTTNGRLKLFGESSLTATSGGFRLISNQISNATTEADGYIVFDLFVRNGTGTDYISAYNQSDDEAIYLTRDSKVVVTPGGSAGADYGLANSVRLAFMQVGRVKWDTSLPSNITGINCTDSATNTQLCSRVTPTIWEPNNESHNSNLIAYYSNVCKKRTALNTYDTTACDAIEDEEDVDTYVVKQNIDSTSQTDIYDGLNTYTNSNLENVDTFTDTNKVVTGQTRQAFFYLSANSITKIRVYIYLEGQDVDNYDLISTGNTISINFGFTKDIFSAETAS